MKKCLLVIGLVAAGLVGNAAFANPANVGVVNVEKIFGDSALVKKQKVQLQADFKAKQQRLQASQAQLKALVDKYQRNKTVMNDTQKKQMETQINAQQSNLMQMEQSFSQQANQAQQQAMQQFLGQLQTATQKVAQAKHLDMVLPNTGVIYSSANLDVTKDVEAAMQ